MTFQGDGPLDTGKVRGGGRGGRVAIGGGAGMLVIVVAALIFGINPADVIGGMGGEPGTGQAGAGSNDEEMDQHIQSCTIEKANTDAICRIVATTNSLDQVWPELVEGYRAPQTVIFTDAVSTNGCGDATSGVGPFYCPADQTAYFDPTFFRTLEDQLGGSDGPLAQEYVVAHEYGHHVQHLLGNDEKARQMGSKGAESGSVRLELQADCFAGVWANRADDGEDAMLEPITDQQINDVIKTARAIGDDQLSGQSSESWTHGSSAQRVRWFTKGYESGDPNTCDTFSTDDL